MFTSTLTLLNSKHHPLVHAEVALLAPNGTYLVATSDSQGVACLELPDDREGTLVLTHPSTPPGLHPHYKPLASQTFRLGHEAGVGSVLIKQGSGEVPGLRGHLSPIVDNLQRSYIYGDNLSFNDLPYQPYPFTVGVPFTVEDAHRHRFVLTIHHILGATSVLEYQRLEHEGSYLARETQGEGNQGFSV